MSFNDLPPRPPAGFPAGRVYAEEVLERSRLTQALNLVRAFRDIAYGADYYQKVDVFVPAEGHEGLPVLLFLHGGGWSGGYKEMLGFMAPAIVAMNAVFVSVSYRLVPEAPYPAAVDDTANAVAWAYRHIAQYGGDPGRLHLGGHSAGAHLAALVALRGELLVERGLPGGVVKSATSVSGPLDLVFDARRTEHQADIRMRDRFIERPADIAAANPIAHVHDRSPPFYISVGENDFAPIIDSGSRMVAALTARNIPVTHDVFAGHGHFDTSARCVDFGHPWLAGLRWQLSWPR